MNVGVCRPASVTRPRARIDVVTRLRRYRVTPCRKNLYLYLYAVALPVVLIGLGQYVVPAACLLLTLALV